MLGNQACFINALFSFSFHLQQSADFFSLMQTHFDPTPVLQPTVSTRESCPPLPPKASKNGRQRAYTTTFVSSQSPDMLVDLSSSATGGGSQVPPPLPPKTVVAVIFVCVMFALGFRARACAHTRTHTDTHKDTRKHPHTCARTNQRQYTHTYWYKLQHERLNRTIYKLAVSKKCLTSFSRGRVHIWSVSCKTRFFFFFSQQHVSCKSNLQVGSDQMLQKTATDTLSAINTKERRWCYW